MPLMMDTKKKKIKLIQKYSQINQIILANVNIYMRFLNLCNVIRIFFCGQNDQTRRYKTGARFLIFTPDTKIKNFLNVTKIFEGYVQVNPSSHLRCCTDDERILHVDS